MNASFEWWARMIGIGTMLQAADVQADHARKCIERLGAQGGALVALAGQVATRCFEAPRQAPLP